MNRNLSNIEQLINQSGLSDEEKQALLKEISNADKQWNILEFKLERTEQVKQTTGVLLEETIEELEQKRKAIEDKNRDLEIESALERVRTVAMGMRTADNLLNICQILFEELTALGFGELRNAMINIVNDEKGSFLNYDFNGSNTSVTPFLYNSHPVMERQVAMTRSANDAFFEHVLTGEDLEDFKAFRVRNGEPDDPKLENISALYYYFYSIGVGSLGISTFSSLTEEKREMLKRFRNVFELAYRRYADIQLAEAQARESQIELALERVRARTMAMQHSEELAETAFILFQQFKELGENPDQATIGIINEDEHVIEYWVTMYGSQINKVFKFSIDEPNVTHKIYKGWKTKKKSLVIDLSGKALNDFATYRQSMGGAKLNKGEKRRVINVAFFSKGLINVQSTETRSEESVRLLERFAGVFEGTYTRFLDLKKAEAQARESQIELALERVRARTMAMQHSDELHDVIQLVFEQFQQLNFDIDVANFALNYKETDDFDLVLAVPHGKYPMKIHVPYFQHPVFDRFNKAKNKGGLLADGFPKNEKDSFFEHFFKYVPGVPEETKALIFGRPGFVRSTILMKNTALTIHNYNGIPYSEAENNILLRFGHVFEQTYTRFNDLQKAEAQIREAQVEAALERTRTQSMIMQHSSELDDTLRVFHQQVLHLGINSAFSFLWLPDEEKDRHIFWAAWAENNSNNFKSKAIDYPLDRNEPATALCLVDWKGNEPVVSYHVPPEGVESYFAAWKELIDGVDQLKPEYFKGGLYYVEAFMKYGCFGVMVENSLSSDETKILGRFAIEFERTYTRFLDLQKAEAQAREGQIQLALERVRARTMAMQKSDELNDAAGLLFKQVKELGIQAWTTGFNVWSEDNNSYTDIITSPLGDFVEPYLVVSNKTEVLREVSDARKGGDEFFVQYAEGERLKETYLALASFGDKKQYEIMLKGGFQFPSHQYDHFVFGSKVSLLFITYEPVPEAHDIFKRFGKVFEQTYTRFLDLQKAEAQSREGQIELALERVRARTMAMQHSSELKDAASILFQQVEALGVSTWTSGFQLWDDDRKAVTVWTCTAGVVQQAFRLPVKKEDFFMLHVVQAGQNGEALYVEEISGKALESHYNYMATLPGLKDNFDSLSEAGIALPSSQVNHAAYFTYGYLLFITYQPIPEAHDIFKRFAKVFDQTYTRFLDLQKAEEQAREAQIEAALEKVRSRSLAMHQTDELREVVSVVFDKLNDLGIVMGEEAASIVIFTEGTKDLILWNAIPDQLYSKSFNIPYYDTAVITSLLDAKSKGADFFERDYTPEEKDHFWKWAVEYSDYKNIPDDRKGRILDAKYFACSIAYTKNSAILVSSYQGKLLSEKEGEILKRFARVFEQAYVRFLDLHKAEAQAREAQIELSLERVRAKTMAMHSSSDVADTVSVMFDELVKLGVEKMVRCGIGILTPGSPQTEIWTAKAGENEKPELIVGQFDMNVHPMLKGIYDAWHKHEPGFSYLLSGDDLIKYFEIINNLPDYPIKYDISKLPSHQYHNDFFFAEGLLFAFTSQPLSDEISSVFKRFAGVFGQTYRRYLDLQKAEQQAKDARVEAALERVRSKTMAMHNSQHVAETVAAMVDELIKLGIDKSVRSGIGIINENKQMQVLTAYAGPVADQIDLVIGHLDMTTHQMLSDVFNNWKKKKEHSTYMLTGDDQVNYYKAINNADDYSFKFDIASLPERQFQNAFYFREGFIYVFTHEQLTAEEVQIYKRFSGVFGLTYRRYLDLLNAESQAREAIKQASVDRVRGEIASMRSTKDLERITPLIWNELTILGIPFIRCGVFIVDEQEQLMHTHLSTADGRALATFNLQFDSEGIGRDILPAWRRKQVAVIHWTKEEFANYTKNLVNEGTVKSEERYVTEHPDTSLDLHFMPFLQGMLYVGNIAPLTPDEIALVQSLADAFSTAYARYEDFNKLEAAKQQVENTLTDLKATQTKLIQSEKMASLGELTAGIAHEIQNPLNFVNNFSEVNQEMIEELEEELRTGNIEEALALAADIKGNEQKINHHGKRADGIVKGMLQHSRTGGGEKQPTNMNTLADEFLRLSYHGLRAKDKLFNAEMITQFDPDLPKINVIPQDMGRVMLNLFNNAFYAVNQKMKTSGAGYRPEVSVTTLSENGQLLIKVKDNGTGMPVHIKEKIMQPFFTTKPTGEGTGLGLSLTYDMIVKGHGGSIQVNSKEGEGSEFVIQLPLN